MATLFVFLVDTAGAPVTGAAPTFDVWSKATPGAPLSTSNAMTELVGGIGGGYFADFATTDGLEYLAIVDGTVAASPRYQRVAFSGTTDERIEVDVPDVLADTAAIEPLVSANLDAQVSLVETEAAAAAREVTNTAEHAATLAAVGLVETEASAAARQAAVLAVLAAMPVDVNTELTTQHGAGSWVGAGLTAAQATQLQETWAALGLNIGAPASYDFPGAFIQALGNVTPIDIAITVVGTTVILTRQP